MAHSLASDDLEQLQKGQLHHMCSRADFLSLFFFFFAVLITNIKGGDKLIPENSTIFLCKCTDGTENCAHSVSTPSASVTMVISDVSS